MHHHLPKALASKRRFAGSPYDADNMKDWQKWLTEDQAAAWFLKVGHDGKGCMPIDVFVRRLFSGDAHVMSLEGSRDGAFPRDKSRKYQHYLWKWQGMIQNAPRFAKSGVYTPSDWEDYFTEACKVLEHKPEAYLKLEHVHGFSGLLNTSNNLFYSRRGTDNQYGCLVYYAAAVGVVCNYANAAPDGSPAEKREVKQKFFLKHSDDITAICMHPSREIAATGQICGPWSSVGAASISSLTEKGKKQTLVSPVFIWNEQTRSGPYGWTKPVQINLPQKEGLSCMAFSQVSLGRLARGEGDVLLTVSKDTDHTVNLWHWKHDADGGKFPVITVPTCSQTGLKGTPPQVFGCAFNPFLNEDHCHRSTFATWGKMHVTFWHYEETDRDAPFMDEAGSSERGIDQYGNARPSVQASISGKAAMFTTPARSTANAEKQDVLCLCYLPMNMVLVGGPNGSITVLAHPEESDSGLTAKQQAFQRKALAQKVDLKKLDTRRELKTVAVQEIQHAHAPATRIKDGTKEGQWDIKGGGCTALVLAETWDVVFSGGGDGRIIEWQMSPEGLLGGQTGGLNRTHNIPKLKMSAGVDMLTPLREFDARWQDRTGPPRMFIGLDCCDFRVGGKWQRKICAGDTENDIWEIVQDSSNEEGPFEPRPNEEGKPGPYKFDFLLEGQSASVNCVAPYPVIGELGEDPQQSTGRFYATACEDGYVYIFDSVTKKHLRKHEIRRHGGLKGTNVPRGCNIGDLLMARACAFSPDGTMLAVSTSGVRQRSEQVTARLPDWIDKMDAPRRVWVRIIRERNGAVLQVEVHDSAPSPDGEIHCDTFQYTLPQDAHPFMDIAIAVPLQHVELKGSFGEVCAREDVPEDLGGVIQVWYYKDKTCWTKEYDIELSDSDSSEPPVLIYEEKVSQEAIDVLTFSSDSTLLAAGSHDNFTYVIGKTSLDHTDQAWKPSQDFEPDEGGQKEAFEPVGVCGCHSSYIKHVDWSKQDVTIPYPLGRSDTEGGFMLQTVCGAYETLYFQPELDRQKRMAGGKLMLANGEVWPVCKQIQRNQRDRIWETWTSTLGFPVMGIWEPDMDGTDINACDRSPLLKGKMMRDVVSPGLADENRAYSRGHLVTANDDGTVGLYHYPSVLGDYATGDPSRRHSIAPELIDSTRTASPHHSFRGHASHVMCVRFLSDAERVVSAGGLDRTTFQWKTHGITKASSHFAAEVKARHDLRQSRTVRSSQAKSLSRDRMRSAVPADKSKQVRESKQLRKTKQSAFHCCFSAFLHLRAHCSEGAGHRDGGAKTVMVVEQELRSSKMRS
eukprot:COSAG02_NODE_1654_length_11481_cov_3.465033_2_plen_1298_part_00